MRKRILACALIAMMLFPTADVSAAEADGEICNPSFEEWNEEELYLTGWTLGEGTTDGAVMGKWSDDGSDAQEGNVYLSCWLDKDYYVDLYQDVSGLEPGYYYVTAYAKNGGGQEQCCLYGGGTGQAMSQTAIPLSEGGVTTGWREVTVRGIKVEDDGIARIGIRTDAGADEWMQLDDIRIKREKDQNNPYRLLKGGDISALTWVEDEGGKYYDADGNEKDALQILAENGWNFARLRLYNSPGKGRGNGVYYCKEGYQDEQDILSLARRAAAKGMELELSFHYSDYWSNGETQIIPHDWQEQIEGLSDNEAVDRLCELVYEYTYDFMKKMEAQGTVPSYVSLGNEIQSGLLYPYGKASTDTWENLARFLTAGSNAVKEASPDTKVIIHLDDAGNYSKYEGFFEKCEEYEVPYDIIGPSYYPFWTDKDVDTIVTFCNDMIDRFDKDIMIMETGYNFNPVLPNGETGQLSDNGCYSMDGNYGGSPEGQKNFMVDLFNGLKRVGLDTKNNRRCLGDLYWDPIMVEQKNVGWAMIEATDEVDLNVISNTTLFGFDHAILPVAEAYMDNIEGIADGNISGRIVSGESGIGNVSGMLTLGEKKYPFVTDSDGYFYLTGVTPGTYKADLEVEGLLHEKTSDEIQILAGGTESVILEVTGASVSGTVTDQDGNAVEGAEIIVKNEKRVLHTCADEDGVFYVEGIPTGSYQIRAEAEGYIPSQEQKLDLKIGDQFDDIDLKINLSSGSIKGTVIDENGQALAGVRITSEMSDTWALTDEYGIFELKNLWVDDGSARYKFLAEKEGYVSAEFEAEVSLGEVTAVDTVVLKEDIGFLEGRVIDNSGNPIQGAAVVISGPADYYTQTDENGYYSQDEMISGKYTVTVSAEGYMNNIRQNTEITYGMCTKTGIMVLPEMVEIVNGGFEQPQSEAEGGDKMPAGWTVEGTSNATNGSCVTRQYRGEDSSFGGANEGEYGLSFWLDEAFTADVSQTLTNLEPGKYVLRAQVYSGVNRELYMYAADSAGTIIGRTDIVPGNGYVEYLLQFEISEDSCTIGFHTDTAGGDWAVVDPVELGYLDQYDMIIEEPEFTAPIAEVSVNAEGTGTVTAELTAQDESAKTADWKLTAAPAEGYVFAGWYDKEDLDTLLCADVIYQVVLEKDRSFVAVFEREETDPGQPGGETPDDPGQPGGETPDDPGQSGGETPDDPGQPGGETSDLSGTSGTLSEKTEVKVVQTGDDTMALPLGAVAIVSGAIALIFIAERRKKYQSKH